MRCISCTFAAMKLSQYLEKHGLSDADFGAVVGRDRATVNRWRNEMVRPDWDSLLAIEQATNGKVTAKDFVEKSAPKPTVGAA